MEAISVLSISIESIIKSLLSRKTPDPDDFINEFFKYLGKKQQQSYININSENKQETVTALFYEARLTSIPNLDKKELQTKLLLSEMQSTYSKICLKYMKNIIEQI